YTKYAKMILGNLFAFFVWFAVKNIFNACATRSLAAPANLVRAAPCGNAAWIFLPDSPRRVLLQTFSPPHPPPLTRLWAISLQTVSPVSPGLSQIRRAPESRPPPRRCLLPPCAAAPDAIPCPAPSAPFRSRFCSRQTGR